MNHPGHTEILAEFCGAADHAMMLYLETDAATASGSPAPPARRGTGLGVVHVTLHVALKRVFELMTTEAVLAKIRLADRAMRPLTGGAAPRIAVSALNPHAGEDGLFGDEEQTIISPAVELGRHEGIDVAGPFPNDTLFYHALAGAYDAVVAMYHDQGHIALKTAGFDRAVNVTLGTADRPHQRGARDGVRHCLEGTGRSIQPDRRGAGRRPDRRGQSAEIGDSESQRPVTREQTTRRSSQSQTHAGWA